MHANRDAARNAGDKPKLLRIAKMHDAPIARRSSPTNDKGGDGLMRGGKNQREEPTSGHFKC